MKKHFLTGLLLAVLSCTVNAQNFISATLLGTKTKAQLSAQFNNLPFIQFGAKYYRVLYTTPDVHGVTDTVSGLLVVPDNLSRVFPRLVYQHGTSGSKQDVPSINVLVNGEGQIGQLFAGLGYVSLLPDYLGLGNESRGFHPYVHAASEAWVAMDMLRAVNTFCGQNNIVTNDQLFVTGYSQGGHGAMALHRAIENDPAHEFTVTAAAPMSGPYSISGIMRHLILSDDVYYYPAYIPNTVLSYQTVYGNIFNDLTEVFKPTYAAAIAQFYQGNISLTELNEQLIGLLIANEGASRPFRMLQTAFVQAVINNPVHAANVALADNDTYNNWTPKAPIGLFYCTADDQVPYNNSVLARDSLNAAGASGVLLQDVMSSANHGECVVPALTNTVVFFLQFQQLGTVGTNAVSKAGRLKIAPNPVKDKLSLRDIPSDGQLDIVSLQGKILYSTRLTAGNHNLPADRLPKGIYIAKFTAEGKFWVEKFMVED